MAEIIVVPLGDSRTRVTHPQSGETIHTDSSPDWGGQGRGFSATDLVAAGLGACIGSSIAPVLERRDVEPPSVEIRIGKALGNEPKRIEHLAVVITIPIDPDATLEKVVLKAASTCAVGRSLGCAYDVAVEFGG